jgi:hypothetical protein
MRSRRSSVLIAVIVISSAEPGCCAGFNRRDRTLDHGRHRTAQPGRLEFVRCFTGATLVLVAGALLSRRTGSAALRVLDQSASFAGYHRVLSTARWSARRRAHRLLHLLVAAFVRDGPVVIDDTIERRWGNEDQGARHLPGGRLASLAFPSPLPTRCVGCLRHRLEASPLQSLCQSEWSALAVRHAARAHCLGRLRLGAAVPDHPGAFRTLRTKAGPTAQEADRLSGAAANRPLAAGIVADSSFSVIELLRSVSPYLDVVTRLRLDAGLYEPPPPRRPGDKGRPRVKAADPDRAGG